MRRRTNKEKEENIWKRKSGKTFGEEKYVFCGDENSVRRRKRRKE